MKKFLIVLLIFISILFVLGLSCSILLTKQMQESAERLSALEEPDLVSVKDGTYIGREETPLVKVEVEVTVKSHKIASIEIKRHDNGKGKPAEAIIDAMVRNNTTDVELVTGATMSSLVIRAAVINALSQGK